MWWAEMETTRATGLKGPEPLSDAFFLEAHTPREQTDVRFYNNTTWSKVFCFFTKEHVRV